MNQIITTFFAGFALLANAQTPLIAHKSHAGTSASFFIDPSSNFGRREDIDIQFEQPKIFINQKFTSLNDSTILLELLNPEQKVLLTDTLPNRKKYSTALFEYYYRDSVQKVERMRIYEEEMNQQQEQRLHKEQQKKQLELQQQQLNEPAPKKKEKKSYLLFLFGITGGGMLLMRLLQQSKSQRSIA